MAQRKSVLGPTPDHPELDQLLELARQKPITDEVLKEQRVSFAFGNAPIGLKAVTKESVRRASETIRLVPDTGQ
jgi:hypothetical protein